jgi:very-short-patch-repair endonuclease
MPEWRIDDTDLHVTQSLSGSHVRRKNVVTHRCSLDSIDVHVRGTIAITTVPRTLLDVGPLLRIDELVAITDFALRSLGLNRESMRAFIRANKGKQGIKQLRSALSLSDGAAESPPESLLRVWMVLAGLPQFKANAEIFRGDEFIARVDLYCEEFKLAVEYEGAHHRSRLQFARDIQRRSRLAALGIEVIQIEATMMRSPRAVILQLAQVLRRRGWRGSPNSARLLSLTRPP